MIQQIPFSANMARYSKNYLLCKNFDEPFRETYSMSVLELLTVHYEYMWVCSVNIRS